MGERKQITIRMPKELLAKWLAALRSGEYAQCAGTLTDGRGFCCLGVLVEISGSAVQEADFGGLPSSAWLAAQHVSFFGHAGEAERNPLLPPLKNFAANANDGGRTFAEIADAIEACAEGF